MDVDKPKFPSEALNAHPRDPRLANRPKQNLVAGDVHTSVDGQLPTTSTPSKVNGNTLTDPFVQSVSELIRASIIAVNRQAERKRLQRKRDTTEGLLRRARAHSNFPSVSTFLEQEKKDEDIEYARIDTAVNDGSLASRQPENQIKMIFGSVAQQSSKLGDEVAQLKTELHQQNDSVRAEFVEENRKLRAELVEENEKLRTEFHQKNDSVRAEFVEENEKMRAELAEENGKLRAELAEENEKMRAELVEENKKVRAELAEENEKMRAELVEENGKLRAELAERHSEAKVHQSRLNTLQAEVDIIRIVAQKAQSEILNAKGKLQNGEGDNAQSPTRITILQDRVMMLERAMADHSRTITNLSTQTKEFEDRMEKSEPASPFILDSQSAHSRQLEDRIERPTARREMSINHPKQLEDRIQIPPSVQEKESASLLFSQAGLDKRIAALSSEVTDLTEFRHACSGQFGEMNNTIATHEKKLESIDTVDEKVKTIDNRLTAMDQKGNAEQCISSEAKLKIRDIETRLKMMEDSSRPHESVDDRLNELNINIESLTGRFNEICEMQAMKDDLQFSAVEEAKAALDQRTEQSSKQFANLRNDFHRVSKDYGRISGEVKSIHVSTAATTQGIAEHSGSIQKLNHVVETIRVGLHSLETRYNSLSTEPIVKNMVVAMQEMYPSAGALTEQVSALKAQIDSIALPVLKADVAACKDELNPLRIKIDKVANGLVKMASDNADYVSRSFSAVEKRIDRQTPWPMEEFKDLQAKVAGFDQRLNAHINAIEQQAQSKETADKNLIRSLNEERNRMDGYVQETNRTLTAEVAELKAAKKGLSESTEKGMELIHGRLIRLDEFMTGEVKAIKSQFNEVFEKLDKQDEGISKGLRQDGGGTEREIREPPSNGQRYPKKALISSDSEFEPEPERYAQDSLREAPKPVKPNAAVALRNHEKKKRKRSSIAAGPVSGDERLTPGNTLSPYVAAGDRNTATPPHRSQERKKPKKKKKRIHADVPVTID